MNRTIFRLIKFLVFFSLIILPQKALATNYAVSFCFQYEGVFADKAGGDYWTDDSPKTARGIAADVKRISDGWHMWLGYTNSDTGCTGTMTLSSTQSYLITLMTTARVYNSNYVNVLSDDNTYSLYTQVVDTNFVPSYSGQVPPYLWEDLDGLHIPQVAAAAGYALNKRYAGLSNQTFKYYANDTTSPPCSPSCTWDEGDVYISSRNLKFNITHELGHAVAIRRDENLRQSPDYSAPNADCNEADPGFSHDFASKEYASTAAVEGFAHFYAATVWNNPYEYNCSFYYYKNVDFDPRDTTLETGSQRLYNCETSRKFLETNCSLISGRGVESDWLSFWWDLHTDEGWTFGLISDIYDCANAHDWDAGTDVYNLLRDCADAYGASLPNWDFYADLNGVDH
jgi:hypothetical protein